MRKEILVAAALFGASGCGPAQIDVDPGKVVNVHVAPASGQMLFCPGDRFLVEVVAKLSDGTSCSTHDASRGCMGKTNAVLNPAQVHLEGTSGALAGGSDPLVWAPDGDPLKTAGSGLSFTAWVTGPHGDGKSIEGNALLKPVYDCKLEIAFAPPGAAVGSPAAAGPDVDVAVTTLSTPFYADAALVRVEAAGQRVYLISPSSDKPVKITTKGQDGMPGAAGTPGVDGKPGADTATPTITCAKGGEGMPGTDGTAGGPGGDGGAAGAIRVVLDDRSADKLRGRVLLANPGGAPGPGGPGGAGGKGGPGGKGGAPSVDCMDTTGPQGKAGANGANGPAGKPGANGPAPTFDNRARESIFGTELTTIQAIEATKAQH